LGVWEVVSLTIEGVTDFLDFLSDVLAIPEDDDVDRSRHFLFLRRALLIFLISMDVHIGLSFGGSENESSKSLEVSLLYYTCNVANVDSIICDQRLGIWTALLVINLVSKLTLESWDHFLCYSEHLIAVPQVLERRVGILELTVLLLDESFLGCNVALDFFQKQVDGLVLLHPDLVELGLEALDVFWPVDANKMLVALVEEVLQFFLAVLTCLNLLDVGES
jgi:hypothetical protein